MFDSQWHPLNLYLNNNEEGVVFFRLKRVRLEKFIPLGTENPTKKLYFFLVEIQDISFNLNETKDLNGTVLNQHAPLYIEVDLNCL